MDWNKGRFIPNIYNSSFFYQENARNPYEGELCIKDDSKDICFWKKDVNNSFHLVSRTADIQEILDTYSDGNDGYFMNASAFYQRGVIHRFFYNRDDQTIWLDKSIDISKFSYYAILSITIDKGKRRYITGLVDSDGSDYLKALIPVDGSNSIGKFTRLIFPNQQYTVEFYDKNKVMVHSTNYVSVEAFTVPIDSSDNSKYSNSYDETNYAGQNFIQLTDASKKLIKNQYSNTIVDCWLEFNQMDKLHRPFIYEDQTLNDLIPIIVIKYSDDHLSKVRYDESRIKNGTVIYNNSDYIEKLTVDNEEHHSLGEILDYKVRFSIDDNLFKLDDELDINTVGYKTVTSWKTKSVVEEYFGEKEPFKVYIEKRNGWFNREFTSITVRGIGKNTKISIPFTQDNLSEETIDGVEYDVIYVPVSSEGEHKIDYFKIGLNEINVSYTESSYREKTNNVLKKYLSSKVYVHERKEKIALRLYVSAYIPPSYSIPIFSVYAQFDDGSIVKLSSSEYEFLVNPGSSFTNGIQFNYSIRAYGLTKNFKAFAPRPTGEVYIDGVGNTYNLIEKDVSGKMIYMYNVTSGDKVETDISEMLSSLVSPDGLVPTSFRIKRTDNNSYVCKDTTERVINTSDSIFKMEYIHPEKFPRVLSNAANLNNISEYILDRDNIYEYKKINMTAANKSGALQSHLPESIKSFTLNEILSNGIDIYSEQEYPYERNAREGRKFKLWSKTIDTEDGWELFGYSLDGYSLLTQEEGEIEIKPLSKKRLFAIARKKIIDPDTYVIPKNYERGIIKYYNRDSDISGTSVPYLVEGFALNSKGVRVSTGALIFQTKNLI